MDMDITKEEIEATLFLLNKLQIGMLTDHQIDIIANYRKKLTQIYEKTEEQNNVHNTTQKPDKKTTNK